MKSSEQEILPIVGTSMAGGFYAGRIMANGKPFALIVAPKAEGQHEDAIWIARSEAVPGACSYFDGLSNTKAMAEAGSKIAQWALGLRIGGADDWYLPAQDELEVLYRNLKPTDEKNYQYSRSGINVSAIPPTYPYTPEQPAQTQAEAFRAGGAEAFDPVWYWSSTQHASDSDSAWGQGFYDGSQHCYGTDSKLRARAVRRLPL